MEKQIALKKDYDSLNKVFDFVSKESPFEYSIEYDSWDVRTDPNGQMAKCILLKKSAMHGTKMYLDNNNNLICTYVIPNKIIHAYFGKSQKQYQNILEIVTEKVKDIFMAGSQKSAFEEMTQVLNKITV